MWATSFTIFINVVSTFLVTSFSRSKEYIILQISFSTFSDVLPAFTCTCLGVNIISLKRSETLAM